MPYRGRLLFLAILGLLYACSGRDSTTATTSIPQTNPTVNAPSGNARTVQLGLQPTLAPLPVVSQITGTLLFPAVSTPTVISLSASVTAPAGFALERVRRAQSGTLTIYEYFTIVSPTKISLPSIPALTVTFPASTQLAGTSVHYGISDLNAQGGLVSFNTQGPGTISGPTVSFAQVPTSITFEAAHKYSFVLYATAQVGAGRIYVANFNSNTVTTYEANGRASTPSITSGLTTPDGVAVDAAGKIYVVSHNGNNKLTAYNADGSASTPTITAGPKYPQGVAVDAAGKIYIAYVGYNIVTTYNADGTQGTPTITTGLDSPTSVAVDAAGKIYVTNINGSHPTGSVTTYNTDGTRSNPTITVGVSTPEGVAVDASGKIYVANYDGNNVTTYNADGTRSTPTITDGLDHPGSVAVDATGKIYVANFVGNTVTTYNPDGTRTTPTITGLNGVAGIAVH